MKLHLVITDENGCPCAACAAVYHDTDMVSRGYYEGAAELSLPSSDYRVDIRRGKLYRPFTAEVSACEEQTVNARLERIHDPKQDGYYSFDAHSHISRRCLGKDAVMDIPKMSVIMRGEDINLYFAGTPYDGENHLHVYHKELTPPITSYRDYYKETLRAEGRADYLVDVGGEYIKYRYGHIVLANFDETPPVDKFRDPMYHSYEQNRHVPGVREPSFDNIPPSRAVSMERKENSFAFFAHPTSWWTLDRSGGFVTNIAATIAFDALTGEIPAVVVQGYGADKPNYRGIWYALLNAGYRLTGVAETDACGDDLDLISGRKTLAPYKTYAHADAFSIDDISRAVLRGDCFASSGPLLFFSVDGAAPGSVLPYEEDRVYTVSARGIACCEGALSTLTVVVNGEEAAVLTPDADGCCTAQIKLPREGFIHVILRDDARNAAVSNPVYIRNTPFLNDGFRAKVTLDVLRNGGGAVGTYCTDEDETPVTFDGKIRCFIRPQTRIYVTVDGVTKTYEPFYDSVLQDCFRYLYSGAFLDDYPGCISGAVPPEAFRIPEILARLGDLTGTLDFGVSPEVLRAAASRKFKTGKQEGKPNAFASATKTEYALPTREAFLSSVPVPFAEEIPDMDGTARRAGEILYEKLRLPEPDSGYAAPLLYTEFADSIFMWGNCFNTMYGILCGDAFPFITLLDNFYAKQHPDGFICRQLDIHTGEDRFEKFDVSSTGPDIFALAEWRSFNMTGDTERLRRVYPVLLAYHRWLSKNRTWQSGAYYSSGWGSGMDNIQRTVRDDYSRAHDHGHLSFIDTTAQQALDCRLLLEIAAAAGITDGTDALSAEYNALSALINDTMWNDEDGFYEDTDETGKTTRVMHIGAYWTLLAHVVPQERLARFCAHLEDPETFSAPAGTRSLSKKDPYFSENGGNYWQGGVWCITDLMIALGLSEYGMEDFARRLAGKHVSAVARVCRETGTIWESYDPLTFAPGRVYGNLVRRDFVGFSGVTPLTLALEYVLGIRIRHDAVYWDISRTDRHGAEQLHWNGADFSLLYENGTVTVRASAPIALTINGKRYTAGAGTTEIGIEG